MKASIAKPSLVSPQTKSDPQELAALLENDETGRQKVDPAEAAKLARQTGKNPRVQEDLTGLADTEKLPAVDLPIAERLKTNPPAAQSAGGTLKYVLIAVVLAGAGAAAWFFIAH